MRGDIFLLRGDFVWRRNFRAVRIFSQEKTLGFWLRFGQCLERCAAEEVRRLLRFPTIQWKVWKRLAREGLKQEKWRGPENVEGWINCLFFLAGWDPSVFEERLWSGFDEFPKGTWSWTDMAITINYVFSLFLCIPDTLDAFVKFVYDSLLFTHHGSNCLIQWFRIKNPSFIAVSRELRKKRGGVQRRGSQVASVMGFRSMLKSFLHHRHHDALLSLMCFFLLPLLPFTSTSSWILPVIQQIANPLEIYARCF